jgi:hypothetical protein
MRAVQRIEEFLKLWRVILPHLPEPSLRDAGRWAIYTDDAVEGAILRAGQRYSPERVGPAFDPTQAYKYVTTVAKALQLSAVSQATGATRPQPGTTDRKENDMTTNNTNPIEQNIDEDAIANGMAIMVQLGPDATHGDMRRLVEAEQTRIASVVAEVAAGH